MLRPLRRDFLGLKCVRLCRALEKSANRPITTTGRAEVFERQRVSRGMTCQGHALTGLHLPDHSATTMLLQPWHALLESSTACRLAILTATLTAERVLSTVLRRRAPVRAREKRGKQSESAAQVDTATCHSISGKSDSRSFRTIATLCEDGRACGSRLTMLTIKFRSRQAPPLWSSEPLQARKPLLTSLAAATAP